MSTVYLEGGGVGLGRTPLPQRRHGVGGVGFTVISQQTFFLKFEGTMTWSYELINFLCGSFGIRSFRIYKKLYKKTRYIYTYKFLNV